MKKQLHVFQSGLGEVWDLEKGSVVNRVDPLFMLLSNERFSFQYKSDAMFYLGYYCPKGEWNGNPLQYSCLDNPMDGGAW